MNKTIKIERLISISPDRVFEAWTTPKDLMNWYSPGNGWTIPYAEVDAKVGGRFKIGFKSPDGEQGFDFTGEFTAIEQPSRISYRIDDGRLVNIDITLEDGQTKIVEEFEMESENSEEKQREGWSAQVDHLIEYLTQK